MGTEVGIGLLGLLIIAGFAALYFKKSSTSESNSNELLVQLNDSLRKEIQEIRKEVGENSQKGRKEIEEKLKDINKGINTFQESSKEDMQKQFASSNKVIKEVTSELEKIKGTNEQVLGFANQMKTLEKIVPEKTGSAFIDLTINTVFGLNSHYDNQMYVSFDYSTTPTSSGGACGTDGWGGYSAPHASLRIPSFELQEVMYPFLYFQNEYTTDTAAPGKWRGSPAHSMQRQSTTDPVVNFIQVQACRRPLMGFAGDGPGAGNHVILDYGGENEEKVEVAKADYVQAPGEIMYAQSEGGGGWGDPLERDTSAVLQDVLDEYVSIEGAARDYGVVIEPDTLTIDGKATNKLRLSMASA